MRNSISLSVYFLLVFKGDVQIVFKTFTASGKMKLIPLTILILSLTVDMKAHEHFSFPPQFQTPNSAVFSSDNSMYLPPESHTTIPYFPIKDQNNLPFPYLPPTGTKAPVLFPTPFPIMLSSTLLPVLEDDEDDNNDHSKMPSPVPTYLQNKFNRTQRSPTQKVEKRDLRANPHVNYQHPIDRIDMKIPFPFTANNSPATPNANTQSQTHRNMIISTDTHRNDQGMVQVKAAPFQGSQYLQTPGVFISSTTETSIPILRLSNEMDLDGSFSYEALGADQTHYVQHSHMENMGTDKEEQVVEGSYSYVGDNGQTYTVHYVADSNGFRASGDHLPVAPPVPEIIQRSIQYNLAEEAKKPPHLKSWQNEEKENEISESERYQRFAVPPPRNLFTGKTPESFSYAFSQGLNTQNNLATAASSQTPIKTTLDLTSEQMKGKINAGTISPQITFLASQGAHVPNVNAPQQTIARMFTTERSTMPQLINYEVGMKESDQENNKALWSWQYGLNSNANQSPDKNTISRSSGEGDDVMINFSDMTPEQYTKMITSNLEPNVRENHVTPPHDQFDHSSFKNEFQNGNLQDQNFENNKQKQPNIMLTSESSTTSTQFENWYKKNPYSTGTPYISQVNEKIEPIESQESISDSRPKLITHREFVPPSQTVTQSYDYENSFYEPRKIKPNIESVPISNINNINAYNNYDKPMSNNNMWPTTYEFENRQKISTTEVSSPASSAMNDVKLVDFSLKENKNDFKPISTHLEPQQPKEIISTTESNTENMFIDNIFLKNLFKTNKNEQDNNNKIREDSKNYFHTKYNVEANTDKSPLTQTKALNEIKEKEIKRKPMDISDIMNYITSKNHFESNKIKPKSRFGSNNFNQRNEIRFIPVQQDRNEDEKDRVQQSPSHFRTLSHQQQDELRGIIKNYKVLQRNNNVLNSEQDNMNQLKRDLSPPPVKMLQKSNLPPLGRTGPSIKTYLPPIYV